jgi:transcription elongation factor GreA
MSDVLPMSRQGYEKLMAELRHMESVEMPRMAEKVAEARSAGDLNENAEYHGARESQAMLQAKINLLRDKLSRARIVDTTALPKDEVVFGATVVLKNLDSGDEKVYTLVGPGEEDYDTGKILITSPVAAGLVGKRAGDVAAIAVPKGTLRYEILEIRFEE